LIPAAIAVQGHIKKSKEQRNQGISGPVNSTFQTHVER